MDEFIAKKLSLVKGDEGNVMDILTTEKAIKQVREIFQETLCAQLNLVRISAPLIIKDDTGLNDDLSGHERKVGMTLKCGIQSSVTQSLAKWKRYSLKRYGFIPYTGMYTNMNALRIDEDLSNLHSYYVDQWDWEVAIQEKDRTIEFLKDTVRKIYEALKQTDRIVRTEFPQSLLENKLPENIHFIFSSDLEQQYPHLSPKEREYEICKEYKAVFLMQIGKTLTLSGQPHDIRAPDYDDWELNGDILLYNPILDVPFELSSMGIRVSPKSMLKQLEESNAMDRCRLTYHQMLLNGQLPYSIGGGIGQSRLCMFLLDKKHIGQVQASEWDHSTLEYCHQRNITLL